MLLVRPDEDEADGAQLRERHLGKARHHGIALRAVHLPPPVDEHPLRIHTAPVACATPAKLCMLLTSVPDKRGEVYWQPLALCKNKPFVMHRQMFQADTTPPCCRASSYWSCGSQHIRR